MLLFLTKARLRQIVQDEIRERERVHAMLAEHRVRNAMSSLMGIFDPEPEKSDSLATIKDLRQELCNRKHQIVCLKGENKKLRGQLKQARAG